MEKEVAFHVLGIQETKDEQAMMEAYHRLLQCTNPEDDPEGFKRLREAYEVAMDSVREPEQEDEDRPKTEVDLWMDRMEALYQDILARPQESRWKQLLDEPVCDGLDTSIEVRERMIVFLMNHIHLPHSIWKLIDDTFQITADMDQLAQQFPMNFLRYVQYYVENGTFIPYELFEYVSLDGMRAKPDEYIDGLLAVKKKIDGGKTDGCLQDLDDLKAFDVYHPFEDVERLRYYLQKMQTLRQEIAESGPEQQEEEHPYGRRPGVGAKQSTADKKRTLQDCEEQCRRLADSLSELPPEYNYIYLYIGEALWEFGQKEKAHAIWQDILEREPEYYRAKYNMVRYMMEQGKYYEAREEMEQLLDSNGQDEEVQSMLQEANRVLIEEYQGKIARGEEDEHFKGDELVLELGWCLFQNDKIPEAIHLVEGLSADTEQEYGYYNLFGRLLYQNKEYERAIPILEHWKGMLWDLKDDGTKETRRRIEKKNMACGILGACYHEVGRKQDAIDSVKEAIAVAADEGDRLGSMQQLAAIMLEQKEYEQTVDICDKIIDADDQYYPAYVMRQEACYELQKGQEVVDDYRRAIEIFPGYYRPYMFAEEVFFFYSQYQDGLEVLDLAKQNGVEPTPRMRLYEAKILRNLAHSETERKRPFEILQELEDEMDTEGWDIEDRSELQFERALLYWDDNALDTAYYYIMMARKMNPDRMQYSMVCANIQVDRENYAEALEEYKRTEEEYGDSAGYHYGLGLCYEGLGSMDKAVECFEKTLTIRDTYADACEKVSDYYRIRYHQTYQKKYLDKAISYATRQLEEMENCYYLVHRGLLYMNALILKPAIADFKKALEHRENDWPAWNNLGCCYKYLGEFSEAIRCFEKAIKYMGEDKDILPYSNMADCYEALGQYQRAVACYKKDLEMRPDWISLWDEIASLYGKMGQYEKALEAYKRSDSTDNYDDIGDLWLFQGEKRKGIASYKKGIQMAPRSQKAYWYRLMGTMYIDQLLDYSKGIKCLNRAVSLYKPLIASGEADLWRWMKCEQYLAKGYYMMGDRQTARKHAKLAWKYFEEAGKADEEEYAGYAPYGPINQAELGWIYLCLGDEEKARKYFERMDQGLRCKQCRYQKCFESSLYLGDLLRLQGDTQGAREAYEETLRRNPFCLEAKAGLSLL